MGNLINPLSRILGFKNNLFWANNFSFYYFQGVYRQKIFKIKCFQRLFKFIFRYLFVLLNIPRVHYTLNINFVGQANNILNIECLVRNLNLYDMASLLILADSEKNPEVMPRRSFRRKRIGFAKLKSRLQVALRFIKARFERVFIKWRSILINLFIQKLEKKMEIKKFRLLTRQGNIKRKYGKMRIAISFCQHFKFKDHLKTYLKVKFNLNLLKSYFKTKFRVLGTVLKLLRSFSNKIFSDLVTLLFRSFFNKLSYDFGIRKVKLLFKRKKITASSIVRNVNYFCYLALRKGYRINYVIKVIRYSVRFLKIVRGFQMIVSGRFYRRGRAMFKVSTLGEMGSQSGKGFLIYRNSERMKEYGMCSVKLLFFFRRNLRLTSKLPIKSRWFHYLKFLRSNYRIRSQFGYIRY